jgi:hypothetical protein
MAGGWEFPTRSPGHSRVDAPPSPGSQWPRDGGRSPRPTCPTAPRLARAWDTVEPGWPPIKVGVPDADRSGVAAEPTLHADEQVLLRALAADPRSDWFHAYSTGDLYLTDRRMILCPWPFISGPDSPSWELSVDSLERVSSVPVPVWLAGVVRVWLRGIRLVTTDGRAKTVVMARGRADEWVTTLEAVLQIRRRSFERVGATPSN